MNTAVSSLPMHSAAGALSWLSRAGTTVWRALEESGRARAQRHLLDFADQCQALQPDLAKELRAAARQGPLG
ncbi:MAG: hypothetical protein ABI702_16060 [Burkholderiales bacterium]